MEIFTMNCPFQCYYILKTVIFATKFFPVYIKL